MLQNLMKCHQVLSYEYYWELSTDTYLVFLNAILCHTIQSIYYIIIKHLQRLTWSSFQHLHGLQLYLVKHSNDGRFFWFLFFVGKWHWYFAGTYCFHLQEDWLRMKWILKKLGGKNVLYDFHLSTVISNCWPWKVLYMELTFLICLPL